MTIVKFILLAALSVLILGFVAPPLDVGREEARSVQSLFLARQIQPGTLPPETLDPWGRPFDIRQVGTDTAVVTSYGWDGVTGVDGYDSNDISTAMSNPPHKRYGTRRRWQMLVALGLAATPWLIWLIVGIRGRMAGVQRPANPLDLGLR